jgi:hypothetical protein
MDWYVFFLIVHPEFSIMYCFISGGGFMEYFY